MPDYDENNPSKYIIYLDANNLCGHAMSQYLPIGGLYWLSQDQIDTFDVMSTADDSDIGYMLEVDLEYPQHLHDAHRDYPLAPESMIVTNDMLSPHTLSLKENLQIKGPSIKKLVPNLRNKDTYVLHYVNLKLYLDQGMILTKIRKVLCFTQSQWLKPYIDFNTEKRMQAQSEFESNFFKLMNNAVFGKTMENVRKRVCVELVNNEKDFKRYSAKPTFKCANIINENLAAVHMAYSKLTLNKPIYVGACILEVSKTLMYDFHYNHMKTKYGGKAKLLFTDTDSLCYEIASPDG